MQLFRLIVPAVLVVSMTGAASGVPVLLTRSLREVSAVDADRNREVARIRVHFDSVLAELETPQGRTLSADASARRAVLVAELERYRDRGAFPHNYDFPGQSVPYFVDRQTGVLCAVANLLAASGRSDIVTRVARSNNNVWVSELSTDTAFTSWLGESGLTLDEAVRIQVPYNSTASVATQITAAASMAAAVGTTLGTGIYNVAGNRDGHSRFSSRVGLVSGAYALGMSTYLITSTDAPKSVMSVGLVAGGLGVAASVHAMTNRHRARAAQPRTILAQRTAMLSTTSIAPLIGTDSRSGNGVMISMRF